MKLQWLLLIIITAVVTGCKVVSGTDSSTPSPTALVNLEGEDFEIYALLLTTEFPVETYYVIERQTGCLISPLEPARFSEILTELRDDTVTDYTKKNQQELNLTETFSQSDKFLVINEQNYWDEIFWGDLPCRGASCLSLVKLKEEYPEAQGVFHLSPIGYSEDRTQALVCTGINDGGYTRDIRITMLFLEADGWIIQDFFAVNQR